MQLYDDVDHALTVADRKLFAVKHAVEFAVLATATSERRNKLTEASLHLMQAEDALKEAKKL